MDVSIPVRAERLRVSEASMRKIGFVALEVIFLGSVLGLSTRGLPPTSPLILALFALAIFRGARMFSFNEVAAPLREPFTEVVPDSCKAGADVHPKGQGLAYVIGSLIACPICTGQWVALGLYAAYVLYELFGLALVYLLALGGAAELLHYVACLFEWTGRLARVSSGKISPDEEG